MGRKFAKSCHSECHHILDYFFASLWSVWPDSYIILQSLAVYNNDKIAK